MSGGWLARLWESVFATAQIASLPRGAALVLGFALAALWFALQRPGLPARLFRGLLSLLICALVLLTPVAWYSMPLTGDPVLSRQLRLALLSWNLQLLMGAGFYALLALIWLRWRQPEGVPA